MTTQVPPSQQSAQGPVHKPGEPEEWTKGIMSLGHQVAGAKLGEEIKEPSAVPSPPVEATGAKASSSGYEYETEARPKAKSRK